MMKRLFQVQNPNECDISRKNQLKKNVFGLTNQCKEKDEFPPFIHKSYYKRKKHKEITYDYVFSFL